MNHTTVKVLQEIIRQNNFDVTSLSQKLHKAKTTIYDCFANLRKSLILTKNNHLQDNELTHAYQQLFLVHPYDFSFLTPTNLKILLLLDQERSMQDIIKKSKLSRFTVHQLLRELKNRGFVNKRNKLISPPQLLHLLKIIKKNQENTVIALPPNATVLAHEADHDIIISETTLPLQPTAFSAFNVVSPHHYYSTKKQVTTQDIFNDAKTISSSKREQLMIAVYYKKNRKKLASDPEFEKLIKSPEYQEFENGI